MNARNFRAGFSTLTEPVTVISREKVLGVFYPGDTQGENGIATTYDHPVAVINQHAVSQSVIKEALSRPIDPVRWPLPGLNTRPFTPVPKKGK
jgi:hypothetical protein